jgi:3-hydroxyacyl-[acyl-carrier-protein] dehydratase
MNAHIETRLSIAPDHPALPGHFPGQPVVPGVVLLDRLIEAAEAALARPVLVTGLPQVKFLAPLLPGEEAHAVIDVQPAMPRRNRDGVQNLTGAGAPESAERIAHASFDQALPASTLDERGAMLSLRFRIEREGAVIAQGAFTLAPLSAKAVAP